MWITSEKFPWAQQNGVQPPPVYAAALPMLPQAAGDFSFSSWAACFMLLALAASTMCI